MPANSGHNVDLLYDRPAALDADLIFGADYVPPRNDVVMRATLPLPVASVVFIPPARLELLAELPGLMVSTLILRPSVPLHVGVASLPGVVLTGEVRYASRTQRPTVGQTANEWQQAVHSQDGAAQGQQDATATPAGWDPVWQRASDLTHRIAHRLPPVLVAAPLQRRTGQQQAMPLHAATWFRHEDATPIAPMRVAVFQNATLLRDTTRFAHQDGDRGKRAGRLLLWQSARPLTQRQGTDFQCAIRQPVGWRGRYQEAMRPPPGISVWVIPEPPEPPRCYTPSGHLLFAAQAPASAHLLFFCENHIDPPDGEPVVVPVRRVYFVINNVTLHRLPDGLPVPVFNLSLSLDAASWTWGFDAQLPAKAEALVAPGDASGPVELVASINGTGVFAKLKFESGVHRVQRVPVTESGGRIHTSAATVAILPEPEEVDVQIADSDLKIDIYRASGAGGQHVNTTDSAVRITHLPTGIVVTQQDERSQHKNKAKAMQVLRTRLYELERERLASERSGARKSMVGSGDRSERIRTYNFPQGRVTDHRINLTLYRLPEILEGEMDEMIGALVAEDEAERLAALES